MTGHLIASTKTSHSSGYQWFAKWVEDVNRMKGFPEIAKRELINSVLALKEKFPDADEEHRFVINRKCTSCGHERSQWQTICQLCGNPAEIVGKWVDLVKGLVVGNVQSGKTASMIGLAASAFDKGYDIVIILTGTDHLLRSQTHKRFNSDLFGYNDEIYLQTNPGKFESMDPRRKAKQGEPGERGNPESMDQYMPFESKIDFTTINKKGGFAGLDFIDAIAEGKKILLPALKNDTLTLMGEQFNKLRSTAERILKRKISVLIIDDEVDFASAPGSDSATTAEHIQNLWTLDKEIKFEGGIEWWCRTISPDVYIGYTATPQGHINNRLENPLYPNSFFHVLRASGKYHNGDADLEPPSSVYYDADTPVAEWYCGGHVFYDWLENEEQQNFLLKEVPTMPKDALEIPKLEDALIDYFVSGAIRWLEKSPDLDKKICHTMLIHNGAETTHHARDILALYRIIARNSGTEEEDALKTMGRKMKAFPKRDPYRKTWFENIKNEFNRDDLKRWLSNDERVRLSYENFQNSRDVLLEVRNGCRPSSQAQLPDFDRVKDALHRIAEIVKIRIINGVGCSENLDFDETYDYETDEEYPPFDAFSIVIGGSLLGRGITLKNLAISYFQKTASQKKQDTFIQRQRWFGYRGSMIEFIRVYSTQELFSYFSESHNDLQQLMDDWSRLIENKTDPNAIDWTVSFTGQGASGSAKSANQHELYFDGTGLRPEITESPDCDAGGNEDFAESNFKLGLTVIRRVLENGVRIDSAGKTPHPAKTGFHGYVLGSPLNSSVKFGEALDCIEVAEIIGGQRFTHHQPGIKSRICVTFDKIAKDLGLKPGELFPHLTEGAGKDATENDGLSDGPTMPVNRDPFRISAWLKLWHYAWKKYDDDGELPACLRNWEPVKPPKFNVVALHGSKGNRTTIEFKIKGQVIEFDTAALKVGDKGKITSNGWPGGQKSGPGEWGGSLNIDNFQIGFSNNKERNAARKVGENGMMMVRLIEAKQQLKDGTPYRIQDKYHKPIFWLSIPEGGPKLFTN